MNDFEIVMTNKVCYDCLKEGIDSQEMSSASMELMEEAHYEFINNNGKCIVIEITKDSDVTVTSRREEGQRLQVENSWISCILLLMSFLSTVVAGRLNYIYADEGELVDNLFTGQRKEDFDYLMKFEHLLE